MGKFTANDLRYNPFTQVFTPYGYGYSGNPKEVHTIPSSAPYWIHLDEIPREDSPSTLFINEQGSGNFTEVSFSTEPAASQFRVAYGGDGTTTIASAGQGIVEFNSADAGKIVEVKYYGLGNILDNQFLNDLFNGEYEVPSFKEGINNLAPINYWNKEGADKNIGGMGYLAIVALTSTSIAFIDSTNDDLRTYYFNGSTWDQVGNDLNIGGLSTIMSITALSATRIAYIDGDNEDLRTYDFDGTNWSQTGNDLNIAGITYMSITALSATRIAYSSADNNDLETYDFDGTDWTQTGNTLAIASVGAFSCLATLSSSRIAFLNTESAGTNVLRAYDFDGTDWTQVGNDLNISAAGSPKVWVTALSATRIVYIDDSNDDFRTYDFDGTDWIQTGNDLNISGCDGPAITALSATRIAYIDLTDDDLRTYEGIQSENTPSPIF